MCREGEQLNLELQQTLNLNEEPTPQLRQKQPMSADEREQLVEPEIAIENGEVQPDVTPIPDLPLLSSTRRAARDAV